MIMHSFTALFLGGALLPVLATAQAPITTSMLLFGAGDSDTVFNYLASVIASDSKGGETLFVTCTATSAPSTIASGAMPSSTDDDSYDDSDAQDCGFGPGLTITLGTAAPTSAYDVYLAEPTDFSLSAHCDIATAASTAVCTQIAGGAEANFLGTSIWTAQIRGLGAVAATTDTDYTDITYFPVTITAGMDKLAAGGAAIATSSASASASASSSGAVPSSTSGSAKPSSSAGITSASATGTTGAVVGAATSSGKSVTSAASGSVAAASTSGASLLSSAAASASPVVPMNNSAGGMVGSGIASVVLYGAAAVCGIGMLLL